jgi:hypothetical protein
MAQEDMAQGVVYVPFRALACWAIPCGDGTSQILASESLRGEIESGKLDIKHLIGKANESNSER